MIMAVNGHNDKIGYQEHHRCCALGPGCHDFAVLTHDGRLMVWDAKVAQLKHEFVPSSHLSAAASTCLAWIPINTLQQKHKSPNRRRKTSISSLNGTGGGESLRSDVIALGTATGSILLFSLKSGDVTQYIHKKNAPHTDEINGMVWTPDGHEIFSVSNDGFISHTSIKKTTVLARFKGSTRASSGNEALTSIQLHPSLRSILVGSLSLLTWWDLDTQSVLKIFEGGHVGAVSTLAVITSSLNNCYAVTGGDNAQKDHTLTVWKLALDEEASPHVTRTRSGTTAHRQEPSAKFSVNEAVSGIFYQDQSGPAQEAGKRTRKVSVGQEEEQIIFGAVTRSGALHAFHQDISCLLTAKKRKPIKARHTVQIATEKSADGSVGAIAILDGKYSSSSGSEISIAYGSRLMPSFETLETEGLDKLTCLIRTPKDLKQGKLDTSTSLVVPETTGARILAPGPSMVSSVSTPSATKRKAGQDPVSMVDRLNLLSKESDQKTRTPKTDSMIQLLLQGLHNRDRRILDSVLDRSDEELIQNTVKKLPIEGVIPLIQELQTYIKGRGMVNQSHSKWLRSVLEIHTAHLLNSPQCQELLGPIYAMLEARTRHFSALLQLRGKLDIMTKQISSKPDNNQQVNDQEEREALLVYQDDSGDEMADAMDDLMLPPSDADDNWVIEDEDTDEDGKEEDEDSEIDLVNGDAAMDSD